MDSGSWLLHGVEDGMKMAPPTGHARDHADKTSIGEVATCDDMLTDAWVWSGDCEGMRVAEPHTHLGPARHERAGDQRLLEQPASDEVEEESEDEDGMMAVAGSSRNHKISVARVVRGKVKGS